jgi:ABC-2 type transport system ATP-binding protein/nitrous oxidase accessory protein
MRTRRQPPPEGAELLQIHKVSKTFGKQVVLDEVSLQLTKGDIALLVGANGSGKSTLLRCVAGLTGFDGTVRVLGADPRSGDGRGLIGYLPQLVALPEAVTVGEVIDHFARLRGVSLRRPAELAAAVPLPDGFLPALERPIGALSGGMRRRVALAVALLGSPPLVLLDEPAASLDAEHTASLWETLQALRAAGGTALIAMPLLVTSLLRHDLAGVADRAVLLDQGRVVHDGPVESLRPEPALRTHPAKPGANPAMPLGARPAMAGSPR